MTVTLNGRPWTILVKAFQRLSYGDICIAARQTEPTIVWSCKDGRAGSVVPGETLVLEDGMVITALHTGNA